MMITTAPLQLPCQVYFSRLGPNRATQLVGFGGKDGSIYVYPFEGYTRAALLGSDSSPLTALAFDPQQHRVVGGSDNGCVRLWDVSTEHILRCFGEGHRSTVTDVDYHRYTDFIATCSRDKSLRIWDTRKKKCLQSYKKATAPLCAVQFSPNGRWAASGCADGIVRLYDLVSGKELNEFRLHTGPITSIHFHPEQYYMAVGSSDGSVSMWEVENFTKVFQSNNLDTPVDAVHLFGKKLLVAADHMLRVYDFTLMSDNNVSTIQSPWNIIGDLGYSSISDEAWFVEFSGVTACMGRVPLSQGKGLPSPSAPVTRMAAEIRTEVPIPAAASPLPEAKITTTSTLPQSSLPLSGILLPPQHQEQGDSSKGKAFSEDKSVKKLSTQDDPKTATDPLKSSDSVHSVLRRRLMHIRVIRSLWVRDSQQAMEYLKQLIIDKSDCSVITDFLISMRNLRMKERITLNNLSHLLDLILYALNSMQDTMILAAMKVLRSMNSKFRVKMDASRQLLVTSRSTEGTTQDSMLQLSRELRVKFDDAVLLVRQLQKVKGPVGEEACEAHSELQVSGMDNVFTHESCSLSCNLHPIYLGTELEALREQVKEALREAKQSSVFCRKIQRDISEFVRSEEISRKQNDTVLDKVRPPHLTAASIDSRLSEFESFIIGRVRKELEENTRKDVKDELGTCTAQLATLSRQQKEQGGKLEAIVGEVAHLWGVMRKEIRGYAATIWDRILALEKKVQSHEVAAASQCCVNGKDAVESRFSSVAREVVSVLSALSQSLEVERKVNVEERTGCFVLLERVIEKMRSLQNRNEALSVELRELQQAVMWNQERYDAVMDSVSDIERRLDHVAAAPGERTQKELSFFSTHVEICVETQLHKLRGELHAMGSSLKMLYAEQDMLRSSQEAGAADVARLRGLHGDLSNNVNEFRSHVDCVNRELHDHMRLLQDSFDRGVEASQSLATLERSEIQQSHCPRALRMTAAQLLHERTRQNFRSHSFHSWLAWTRGRSQLKRDKMLLMLFTKQRNQVSELSQKLYKLQEGLQSVH